MRIPLVLGATLIAAGIATGPTGAMAAPGKPSRFHIVAPHRPLDAGEQVQFALAPKPPEGTTVNWFVGSSDPLSVPFGIDGIYRAPYEIPPATPPVRVSARISEPDKSTTTVETLIHLSPGSVPGASDCLGPGQRFSSLIGEIEHDRVRPDGLPELLQKVDPEYPQSAWARGVEDTVVVRALVCRSGRVLDAITPTVYFGPRGPAIEQDPKLLAAAIAAVKQYVFSPATSGGVPIAVWVDTAVAFRR